MNRIRSATVVALTKFCEGQSVRLGGGLPRSIVDTGGKDLVEEVGGKEDEMGEDEQADDDFKPEPRSRVSIAELVPLQTNSGVGTALVSAP